MDPDSISSKKTDHFFITVSKTDPKMAEDMKNMVEIVKELKL